MKILFLCGSLEPGHDGVGDYTRALAGALNAMGVATRIMSIMDRSADGVLEEVQLSRQQKISVTRLSNLLPFDVRKVEYDKAVADFIPDYISLQYVPYAYSPKGIPFDLPRFLKVKDRNPKWHFMIHEAYVWSNLNFKLKLLKVLMKRVLKSLVKELKPNVVHTSNPGYQKLLNAVSVDSQILGLFGNIEILPLASSMDKASVLQGVFFGSGPMHDTFPRFAKGLKDFYIETDEPINIVFCGRQDFRAKDFVGFLKTEFSGLDINIIEKGPLENDEISMLFLTSHFGISREAPLSMGKSGTVISMLEHGLPLWVPLCELKEDFEGKFDFRLDQCFTTFNSAQDYKLNSRYIVKNRLDEIANQFYQSLT